MIVNKPNKKKEVSRYSILYIIMFIILGTIVCKLLYLQVYKHDDYKEKADVSSTKFISENAPRGDIYDSSGTVIATNKQTYALTYMEATDATKAFYRTMDKVFQILEENGEKLQDDFGIIIDDNGNFAFDESINSESAINRFKRDRGMNEEIERKLFEDKEGDFTDEEIKKVDTALSKISVEDTFYYLVKHYDLYKMLLPEDYTNDEANELYKKYKDATGKEILEDLKKSYSLEEIRRYMVVKDAIKIQSFKGYKDVTISNNIKRETAFIIYQRLSDLPGINVTLKPVRYYPYDTLASSVLGYVSSINSAQQESYELRGYDVSTDLIGVSGIEAAFEDQLRGIKGGRTVKVNSQGRETEELFELESYKGNSVHLTIDKSVQYAAQEALKDTILDLQSKGFTSATRGAVVALEVGTGRVLAMASYPEFNPNDFAIPNELSSEKFKEYFNPDLEKFGIEHIKSTGAKGTLDELFPINKDGIREDMYDLYPRAIFNYATQGLIPPGSTFKPVTATAGLMEGVITSNTTINDVGIWSSSKYTGDREFSNFQKIGHGATDVRKALEVSSNYFFYETAIRLYEKNGANIQALDSIAKYAWKFGLGMEQGKNPSTGIEIQENFGQTYNFESWKNNNVIPMAKFDLVNGLEAPTMPGVRVPFDIKIIDSDPDDLEALKEELKDNVASTLAKVGTDKQVRSNVEYAEEIIGIIKEIMNTSERYKQNVINYETTKKQKVNLDKEAEAIANAIAQFVVNDKTTEIVGAAQIVIDGIGQGMNSFTPLQMANYVATLASGGTRYKVSLVDKITTPSGEVIKEFEPEIVDKLDISPEILQAVKEGMRRVNTSPSNATTYSLFNNFPIAVCGKTGTADFGTQEQYDFQGRKAYGNYISFAPMDNPKIAIFSTIYDGNRGSASSPIHKPIYEAFFKDELLAKNPDYASQSETFQKYVVNTPVNEEKSQDDTEDNIIEEGNVPQE